MSDAENEQPIEPSGQSSSEPAEGQSFEGRLQYLLRERFRLGPELETGPLTVHVRGWARITWSGMTTVSREVIVEAVAAAVEATPVKDQSIIWLHRTIQTEVAQRIGLRKEHVRSVLVETIDNHTAVATWQCRAELSTADMNKLITAAAA